MDRSALRRRLRGLAIVPWALLVAGCGFVGRPDFLDPDRTTVRWTHVTLAAAADANRNSPVAVDLVLVTDRAVLDAILALSSAQWFAIRGDLAKTHPQAFARHSWELVPGQRLTVDGEVFGHPRVIGALAFADYPTPGAHRVRIDTFRGRLAVRLDAEDLDVSSTPAP